MRRFFVEPGQIRESVIHIIGSDVNHIRNVLRMGLNDELVACDGAGHEYHCYIESMAGQDITAHIMYVQDTRAELPSKIYLFQGLPKGDKMEWLIQKAVELGVYEIIPMETIRTVVKWDREKAGKKVARWQQIAENAAKQCGRGFIPPIHPVCSFPEALEYGRACPAKWIPYERAGQKVSAWERLSGLEAGQSVAIFIGPEGGFDESEISAAQGRGYDPITLGRRILRTETAGMALLSALMFRLERV